MNNQSNNSINTNFFISNMLKNIKKSSIDENDGFETYKNNNIEFVNNANENDKVILVKSIFEKLEYFNPEEEIPIIVNNIATKCTNIQLLNLSYLVNKSLDDKQIDEKKKEQDRIKGFFDPDDYIACQAGASQNLTKVLNSIQKGNTLIQAKQDWLQEKILNKLDELRSDTQEDENAHENYPEIYLSIAHEIHTALYIQLGMKNVVGDYVDINTNDVFMPLDSNIEAKNSRETLINEIVAETNKSTLDEQVLEYSQKIYLATDNILDNTTLSITQAGDTISNSSIDRYIQDYNKNRKGSINNIGKIEFNKVFFDFDDDYTNIDWKSNKEDICIVIIAIYLFDKFKNELEQELKNENNEELKKQKSKELENISNSLKKYETILNVITCKKNEYDGTNENYLINNDINSLNEKDIYIIANSVTANDFFKHIFPQINTEKASLWLQLCSELGYYEIAKIIIEKASINQANKKGMTALHLAAFHGHENIVKLLIENKADINTQENVADSTALHIAAFHGHENIVELLIKNGANLDIQNKHGKSALHLALENSHMSIAMLIIKQESSNHLNIKDNNNQTALHLAAFHGHENIVKLLIENKADINKEDNNNLTALHMAALSGHENIVELLIENKADINKEDNNNRTALHIATSLGYMNIVRLLIQNLSYRSGRQLL